MNDRYEIRLRGRLSRPLAAEFERMDVAVTEQPLETLLNASFEDQSALYGMLRRIEGLGVELVELRRVPRPRDSSARAS